MQTQAVAEHIVSWLKNYALHAQANGFVVGVSGGVDSAVVSTLCAQTGLDVLCLDMPIRQKPDQQQRALAHINWLQSQYANVRAQTVDLTPTFEQFEQTVSGCLKASHQDLAMANTRSRLRMVALYYFGQTNGLLVAGTGNKVEDFGVGFFTKYGDGGVDISPIADLLKTQVYELAEYLNILPDIRHAVPTDGLWDNERTDEAQMGASYPELEWAMAQVEQGKTCDEFSGRQQEVLAIFQRLNRGAQHKIQPIPVCKIPPQLL